MIAIIDYGVGNLYSLCSSLNYLGIENIVTNKKEDILKADKILLPGVGAFSDAIDKLKQTGLVDLIKKEVDNGKPIMGICLGMQLLFEKSYEFGEYDGLGFLNGTIDDLNGVIPKDLKVPHMGWNKIKKRKSHPLLKYINDGEYVYYVHSFYANNCEESILATSEYGIDVPGVVGFKNIYGTQFHPEKSSDVGLKILKAFSEI